MVKLADIAKVLNLNVSVVSRALNPNPDKHAVVKKETAELIRKTAAEMGYVPNRQAAFLGKGKGATIFCYLPDVSTRLINDLMFGITEEAGRENFPVNFFFGKNIDDFKNFLHHGKRLPHTGLITYLKCRNFFSSIMKNAAISSFLIQYPMRRKRRSYFRKFRL